MAVEYRVVDELPEKWEEEWGPLQYDGYEEALIRYVDGEPDKIVWIDGGEPEDMILCRNLSDFVDELNWLITR